MEELTAINKRLSINYSGNPICPLSLCSSDDSLYAPPLPTLPFDLVAEILCMLPVKLLLQLRCICKSWSSLISDHKFAKKHLSLSTTPSLYCVIPHQYTVGYVLRSYPLNPVFTNIITNFTQFKYCPDNFGSSYKYPRLDLDVDCFVGSCNGILCIAHSDRSIVILWNPSISKVKQLHLVEKPPNFIRMTFGFGYDSLTDNYKVVVVFHYLIRCSIGHYTHKTEVRVHTSSTNFWKTIQEFPFDFIIGENSGKLVNGTINWLASIDFGIKSPRFIVSFDVEKESYQKIFLPDSGGVNVCNFSTLVVLRDCLCVTYGDDDSYWGTKDVWVMKEYGNKDSWTKLFTFSSNVSAKPVYFFEDDKVLLKLNGSSFVYDSRIGTLKPTDFKDLLEVCVESLISPCS